MGMNHNQMTSNEISLKRNSNDSNEKRSTNNLPVKERDYMITTAMKRLRIGAEWKDAVARGANYIPGDRFWQLVDAAMNAKTSSARYFIKCLNNEMFR